MQPVADCFTPAQIGRALGVSAQAARKRLEVTPPARTEPAAWPLDRLPLALIADLTTTCQKSEADGYRFRNLLHFVSDPPPMRKPSGFRPAKPSAREEDFAPIVSRLELIADKDNPTPSEVALVWNAVCQVVESAAAKDRPEKKFRRALFRWLSKYAPFLKCSRRTLRRKLAELREAGGNVAALADKRPAANQARRVKISPEDRNRIESVALQCHAGDLTPAYRELLQARELSDAICGHYTKNPARKSYVPAAVRRELGPELKALAPWQRGQRQARLNGPYIERDWSSVAAGDWFTSDDFTLEVYFWIDAGGGAPLLNESGVPILTRGQWLPLVDCRSKKILISILIPEKRYTGAHIRTLLNHGGDIVGLPRKGYHFERGPWKESKLVGGAVPWGDVEMNFADRLGLRIVFALPGNAKAKIVENVGKLFQASLRDVPGWVGSNEQVVKLEAVQAAKRDVEARRKHPAEAGFLSFSQWRRLLMKKEEAYNATPQESRIIGGNQVVTMSPDEAWKLLQRRNAAGQVEPVAKLPDDCRYLLASHTWRPTVGRNGIKVPKSMGGGTYRRGLAALQRREITAYFDPELPDVLSVVTDEKQVLTVPREKMPGAFNPEDLAAAAAGIREWNDYYPARLSELHHCYLPQVRRNIVAPETANLGNQMRAGIAAHAAEQEVNRKNLKRAQRWTDERGLPVPTQEAANMLNAVEAARHSHED